MKKVSRIKPKGEAENIIIALGEMISRLQELEIEEIMAVNLVHVDTQAQMSGASALYSMAKEMCRVASLTDNTQTAQEKIHD